MEFLSRFLDQLWCKNLPDPKGEGGNNGSRSKTFVPYSPLPEHEEKVKKYLEGLLWNVKMYQQGCCSGFEMF
jgi:hypothetical protein